MATKKTKLESLTKKGVSAKKAGAVKGGMRKLERPTTDKLAANHNLTVR